MYEIVIVGSGVSGTSAALHFSDKGIKPCIIDVGLNPYMEPRINENFYMHREKKDCFDIMVGEQWEGLYNLMRLDNAIPAKLTSPAMRFVIDRSHEFNPVRQNNFSLIQSFSRGGLANAWGAGLYRYNDRDLESFPIKASDLSFFYDRLSNEIGISGENDDLTSYFGKDNSLQRPLQLSENASRLYKNYMRKKERLNRKGIFVGHPRLGVLSEKKNGRKPCDYRNLEFWKPNLPYIYTPSLTLERLIKEKKVLYKNNLLVKSWQRKNSYLVLKAESIENGEPVYIKCKKLVLAAGAVNSAKIALASRQDYQTKLSLLDNHAVQLPFVLPGRIGARLETDAFGLTQLNLIYDSRSFHALFQGSILEVTSPARAEFFKEFPFSASENISLIRLVLPSLLVMQLFLPVSRKDSASFYLNRNGEIVIRGKKKKINDELIKDLVKILRMLGGYTAPFLVVKAENGHGIHYGGTLPMTHSPSKEYTCSRCGELYGEPGVYVVDGSLFPVIPAKNSSFTIMANAMRIADHISSLKG